MNAQNDVGKSSRIDRYRLFVLLIVVLALALRWLYALLARVDEPLYGDSVQYMAYAWNLLHDGILSSSPPHSAVIVPDGYRGPGYPLLLAGALGAAGGALDGAIRYAIIAQVVLSSITVYLTITLARFWLPPNASLLTGLLTALWPHLITFANTLMSETLFGFLIALALLLLCRGEKDSRHSELSASGIAFGAAYLVNPTILFFPFVAGAVLARRKKWRAAAIFMVCFAVIPMGWSIRNAQLSTEYGASRRAAENFVEGSSPLYMRAFNSRWVSPEAKQIVDIGASETTLLLADPRAGLAAITDRMSQDPWAYFFWYAIKKPSLLWDWPIIVGTGDIYYPPTSRSPFERIAVLQSVRFLLMNLNPAIFALAMAAAIYLSFSGLIKTRQAYAAVAVALFVLYVTAIHVVFQSEPRYGIPYRPEEILLAVTALFWFFTRVRSVRERTKKAATAIAV